MKINIDDDTGMRSKAAAKKKPGDRKGYPGKATTQALECRIRQQSQEEIARDALALLETGYPLGTHMYTERKDLYDRATGSY